MSENRRIIELNAKWNGIESTSAAHTHTRSSLAIEFASERIYEFDFVDDTARFQLRF